ncbi:hydrogenase expression/formation protein HypD [Methylomarinovum tepidoasis]|uniref:Hydrogenase maturation factor n=1 Tax=Methylomarinovum tepidoasis TaxID=2840183 RepID=A0AAU9C0P9_9GAMM|nr:hydrogenase formation protein HypD [Methylomarinovum sp. IN45]BCX89660.1 hydrogenase expression/formation protein HypD [Methylomarinovum sp. IN45]
MRHLDEYRDPVAVRRVTARIRESLARLAPARPLQIMEFCGGHTHAIYRYGLHDLLPDTLEWVHGPGCPVCVLPRERIDAAVELARRPEVILTTFGDVLRVPGTAASLQSVRGQGADVRVVYSPLDALALARREPRRQVVFFAVGFETTAPATAFTVLQAAAEGVANFSVLCQHITSPQVLRTLLDDPDLHLDGIVAPGHVCTVVGAGAFAFVAGEYRLPIVVSGFEPLDLLQSLALLLQQRLEGRCELENQYRRAVTAAGNPAALEAIEQVFEPAPQAAWRGLGAIPDSSLRLRPAYAAFDAERRFGLAGEGASEAETLPCGEVLKGRLRPGQCPHFGNRCRPESPLGALMVSSEGACAAWYRYRRRAA